MTAEKVRQIMIGAVGLVWLLLPQGGAGSQDDTVDDIYSAAQRSDAHILALAWSPDGTLIAAGDSDGNVQIWDAQTRSVLYSFEAREADWNEAVTSSVKTLDWSPDGNLLAAGIYTDVSWSLVQVIDPYAQEILTSIEFGEKRHRVSSVAWSPDGTLLAAGGQQEPSILPEGWVRVWDTITYELVAEHQQGHADMVTRVSWSPDGSRLASAAYDETFLDNNVMVWDTTTWELVLTLEHSEFVFAVAWSPDGTRLATGGGTNAGLIWDAETGQVLVESQDVPPDPQRISPGAGYISWNPHNPQQMVSLSTNYFIYWDAVTGQITDAFHTWVDSANYVWCPDENCLVYANNGTLQTLSLPSPLPEFEPLSASSTPTPDAD